MERNFFADGEHGHASASTAYFALPGVTRFLLSRLPSIQRLHCSLTLLCGGTFIRPHSRSITLIRARLNQSKLDLYPKRYRAHAWVPRQPATFAEENDTHTVALVGPPSTLALTTVATNSTLLHKLSLVSVYQIRACTQPFDRRQRHASCLLMVDACFGGIVSTLRESLIQYHRPRSSRRVTTYSGVSGDEHRDAERTDAEGDHIKTSHYGAVCIF
ncbi:hypothetical protein DB88DRAFT_55392 [Papiliotrema laurentii]|uniref:Uncharacterized protein n=1 Tax=Papiliotrema laurentii TaxID=5418 RepID=A0AAD9FX72_PAPLA|nr:hypothetical protein DB88DRAFT_55392 [Papiliotrema laurentii]